MLTTIKNNVRKYRDWAQLVQCKKHESVPSLVNLSELSVNQIDGWLNSAEVSAKWEQEVVRLKSLRIPEASGGVNQGDQKAIFSLVHGARPTSVLEVGTHIGASTVHLASALRSTHENSEFHLTTVDLIDVNNQHNKHWEKYSSPTSPLNNLKTLGLESKTEFVVSDSVNFLSTCESKFDFIFLDGDHGAKTVYKEVPLAISLLKPNGIILLHDYFPANKPLWSNGAVISGPYLAMERLNTEFGIKVLPVGDLPWPTKLGSNASSLAVISKA